MILYVHDVIAPDLSSAVLFWLYFKKVIINIYPYACPNSQVLYHPTPTSCNLLSNVLRITLRLPTVFSFVTKQWKDQKLSSRSEG